MIQLHTKKELRQIIVTQRIQNHNIDCLLEQYLYQIIDIQHCKNICAYLPIKNEVNILAALNYFWKNGIHIYMPVVIAAKQPLVFRLWQPNTQLIIGKYGISEPNPECQEINTQSMQLIDIILIPCLGFFRQKSSIYRLGYGGGFYDRTIAEARKHNTKFRMIGICHSSQYLEGLSAESHDIPLDMVLTPHSIIK
jgi:5-formyltetrahydrofolate cyclo-ligase